jgi:hypothetical protein
MRRVGAEDQARALADRVVAQAEVTNADSVIGWLRNLRIAGAEDHLRMLAGRAAAEVELSSPGSVARLLEAMRQVGAEDQAQALAARAATDEQVIQMVGSFYWSGSFHQSGTRLLEAMRQVGAEDQARVLTQAALSWPRRLLRKGAVAWDVIGGLVGLGVCLFYLCGLGFFVVAAVSLGLHYGGSVGEVVSVGVIVVLGVVVSGGACGIVSERLDAARDWQRHRAATPTDTPVTPTR